LHLDHAGGLEKFVGTDIPIYVHEQELREQWYQVLTGHAGGVYVPGDLHQNLNWKPITTTELELFDGMHLRHMPGHTPGLMTMQVELENAGNFFFTSDLFHIREQYETPLAPGWLLGHSRTEWWRNRIWMEHLVRQKGGTLVFGHDAPTLEDLRAQATIWD
jgi:glyoxylase-like metal-dependent hydrolase (beta-lactamase superfamily II)